MTAYVDTLKLATRLEDGGFTAIQAKTMASALGDAALGADVATKADLAHLATKADLADLVTKSEWHSLKAEVQSLRSELQLTEQRTILRLGGMLVVMTGILLTGMRYFH